MLTGLWRDRSFKPPPPPMLAFVKKVSLLNPFFYQACTGGHTWAPLDHWVCTAQPQRSGMGVQNN